ncbi:MAG: phosphate ABC transporter permease subunit PstC, partial [Halanaeroarchaeum sp.]
RRSTSSNGGVPAHDHDATLSFRYDDERRARLVAESVAVEQDEIADERSRAWLKPALEVLAGVPTVVYGVFALIYITPFLAGIVRFLDSDLPVFSRAVSLPPLRQFNALSASIVVGIMIIPMVASISEDAMEAVPDSLREAAYGLGATKFEVATTVVVPSATSGIVSSFILALSRAIGETMAVTIAAGMSARLVNPLNPLDYFNSIMPMTAAMVKLKTGEATTQSAAYRSLFAIGLTLFVITFAMNVVSELISGRFREVYE